MDPRLAPLADLLNLNTRLLRNCLDGVDDAAARHRPAAGTNHLAFLTAHLVDGPTTDFNAIWRSAKVSVTVERRAMHGALWCIPEQGVSWFVYFLAGHGRVKSDPDKPEIAAGDAIWLQSQAGAPRLILEAFGEALWCRITAL